tara:strand:+ start:231 stop:653 length:423 start_codon:yes stop_codon:yes gene_type:complete
MAEKEIDRPFGQVVIRGEEGSFWNIHDRILSAAAEWDDPESKQRAIKLLVTYMRGRLGRHKIFTHSDLPSELHDAGIFLNVQIPCRAMLEPEQEEEWRLASWPTSPITFDTPEGDTYALKRELMGSEPQEVRSIVEKLNI